MVNGALGLAGVAALSLVVVMEFKSTKEHVRKPVVHKHRSANLLVVSNNKLDHVVWSGVHRSISKDVTKLPSTDTVSKHLDFMILVSCHDIPGVGRLSTALFQRMLTNSTHKLHHNSPVL